MTAALVEPERDRTVEEYAEREKATRQYIQSAAAEAAPSTADELAKLGELRNSGVITEEEFNAQKARLLAG